MDAANAAALRPEQVLTSHGGDGSAAPAVSWGAIFAGAAAAAALSLILLVLGTGLGLASVSPWSSRVIEATTFGTSAIVWVSFVGLVASAVGGYLAGRLRTKWVGMHTDEVYFRDTAHGFLAWSVATLVTAAFLASATGAIVGAGVQAGVGAAGAVGTAATTAATGLSAAGGARSGMGDGSSPPLALGYFTDSLFRANASTGSSDGAAPAASPAPPANATAAAPGTAEVSRIFLRGMQTGALPAEDTRYVGQLVAQRTGITQPDAERRVSDTFTKAQSAINDAEAKAKDAADKARRAGAYAALWIFVSLLLGAFSASLAATFGGRQRDL